MQDALHIPTYIKQNTNKCYVLLYMQVNNMLKVDTTFDMKTTCINKGIMCLPSLFSSKGQREETCHDLMGIQK